MNRPESRYVEKKAYLSRYAHERLLAQRESPARVKAEFSDEWFRQATEELPKFIPFLIKDCGVEFRGRVLEIGAGGAWLSAELSKLPKVVEVITTDFSPKLLQEQAPKVFKALDANTAKITRMPGDFHELDFPANHFDFVVSSAVLHQAANIVQVLREAKRVLKPGGQFIAIREPVWPLVKIKSRAKMMAKLVATGRERAFLHAGRLQGVLPAGRPAVRGQARQPRLRVQVLRGQNGQRHHPRPLRLHRHQARQDRNGQTLAPLPRHDG